jgi:hypothetical protein
MRFDFLIERVGTDVLLDETGKTVSGANSIVV